MKRRWVEFSIPICVALFIAVGCGRTPQYKYSLSDEKLLPYAAMYQVDREQYCLTEIDAASDVAVFRASSESAGYDVQLALHTNQTIRVITFVYEDGRYIWIRESETHYSGQTYMDWDGGPVQEELRITYTEREFGQSGTHYSGPVGLNISYHGNRWCEEGKDPAACQWIHLGVVQN
jgi:hypothetical protein